MSCNFSQAANLLAHWHNGNKTCTETADITDRKMGTQQVPQQRHAQHAVHNHIIKTGSLCKRPVQMQRVVIAGRQRIAMQHLRSNRIGYVFSNTITRLRILETCCHGTLSNVAQNQDLLGTSNELSIYAPYARFNDEKLERAILLGIVIADPPVHFQHITSMDRPVIFE